MQNFKKMLKIINAKKNEDMYIIEEYLLKYYFESHLICKWNYYIQTILNQSNIMVPYIDIIGQCHIVAIIW